MQRKAMHSGDELVRNVETKWLHVFQVRLINNEIPKDIEITAKLTLTVKE